MSAPRFDGLTAEELRAHRETVLLRLLFRTQQAETNELAARLHARGHESVSASHIGLLGHVDTEGTRLVTLAARTGSTRQAVSQLVAEIEKRGFLERAPDPDDGRAVLVRHTDAGRRLLVDALELMHEIEAGYAELIGAARMQAVKDALTALNEALYPETALRSR